MQLQFMCVLGLSALLSACGGGATPPAVQNPETLAVKAEKFRAANNLPGLSVVLVDQDKLEVAAVGTRRTGAPELLQPDDKMQLGSLTKSLTATVIAGLVAHNKLRWDSTLVDIFPGWRTKIHPAYLNVTVEQLLRHRSGMQRDLEKADVPALIPLFTGTDAAADRLITAQFFLGRAPAHTPGTELLYSNLGYLVLGLVAEAAAGEPYVTLLDRELLTPLQVSGYHGMPEYAGPATPSGHTRAAAGWQLAQYTNDHRGWLRMTDAAGGLSMSMPDYGRYLREHLRGLKGQSTLLDKTTFERMHTPVDTFAHGWAVQDVPGLGRISFHTGSTHLTYYAITVLVPGRDRALAVVCNCYSLAAAEKVDEFIFALAKAP